MMDLVKFRRGAVAALATVLASAMGLSVAVGAVPQTHAADDVNIADVPDSIAFDAAPRLPLVESSIGRGAVAVGTEGHVALPGVDGSKAALVRVSVFGAKADVDVTSGGAPVLHAAKGQDASAAALLPVRNGGVPLAASADADVRVEVLATFDSNASVPGSTLALDAPVTRLDTAAKTGLDQVTAEPQSFGVIGLGGVPSSDVRSVYLTLTIDASQAGTLTVAGQSLAVAKGRSVISTIAVPGANGAVDISADASLAAGAPKVRADVRGYVAGAPQNVESVNVSGSFVPASGAQWQAASASEGKDGSVALPHVGGSVLGVALVSASATSDTASKHTFVDLGEDIAGRSSGVLVDRTAGALPQLELVERTAPAAPVSVRGANVNANALALGDILGDKPQGNSAVNVAFTSPKPNDSIDFGKTGGVTLTGTVSAAAGISSVDIYGDGQKVGTADVTYTAKGADWTFKGAAPHDGKVNYGAKVVARDGSSAQADLSVNVTIPGPDANIINPDVRVLPAGDVSPVSAVDAQSVTFSKAPEFAVGAIIVSAAAPHAPQGFLRWVDAIQKVDGQWKVTTHQAALTDAILQGKISQGASETPDQIKLSEPDTVPSDKDMTVLDGPEKPLQLTGDSAKVAERSGSAQAIGYTEPADGDESANATQSGLTVAGNAIEQNSGAARASVIPASATAFSAADKSRKKDWIGDGEWVDATDKDTKQSVSFSLEQEWALSGEPEKTEAELGAKPDGDKTIAVDISHESPSERKKLTKHLSADGGVTYSIKGEVEAYSLFGFEIDRHWHWNPVNYIAYLKAETGSNISSEFTVAGSASLQWKPDPIKLGKLEFGSWFDAGIPIYVSTQTDITAEPSIKAEGKISWTFKSTLQSQGGVRHEGVKDSLDLDFYHHMRGITGDEDSDESTCPDRGFKGEVSLNPEIGLGVNPKFLVDDAAGPGFKLTPKIGAEFKGSLETNGKFTRSAEYYGALTANATFDLQVPIIDHNLLHKDFDEWTVKVKIGEEKEDTIPACKPDEGGSSGSGSGGGGDSWDASKTVTINWTDPKSGKSQADKVKTGTQFRVDQASLESKLGLAKGALNGMKGVSTQKDGKGKVTRVGEVYQAVGDATLYVFYTDPTLPPSVDANNTDIVFVIDSTGSMSDEIDSVKENVSKLADSIKAVSKNYRMALVDYKDAPDQGDPYQSRVDVNFTSDVDAFKSGVSDLYADGGGDWEESVYSGINTALDLKWRPEARKSIFVIGDAPGKDPEPVTGFTQNTITDKANKIGAGIFPLGRVPDYSGFSLFRALPNDSQQERQRSDEQQLGNAATKPSSAFAAPTARTFGDVIATADDEPAVDESSFEGFTKGLANSTGGTYTEYTSGDFVDKLLKIVVAAAVAPDVSVNADQTFHVGDPVHLSVTTNAAPDNPVVGYDWNFGTGKPSGESDATTTEPKTDVTFAKAGTYTITVTARTKQGVAGRGTLTIVVTDRVPTTTYSGTVTRAKGQRALFTLPVLPGTEAYGTLTFDNGSTVKKVPGQGEWRIARENNLIVALFVPESGYAGTAPTPQTYLLRDASGAVLNGRLTALYR